MNQPFINRWSPAVVVLRWRHLFWSLPLLALLIGGGREWQSYQRSIQARAVIERAESATIAMDEIRDLVLSDAVLQEAALSSGYPKEWNTGSAENLRQLVHCEAVPGSSLLAITVKGRSNPAKASLCDRLPTLVARKAEEMRSKEVSDAEAALAALNAAHKENGERYRQHILVGLNAPQEPFVATPEFLETRRQLEESDKALEAARTAYINLRLKGVVSGAPISIIERAATPVPFTPMELVAPSARASCWIGGSVLLAVLLAYLLEWRFPRRIARRAAELPIRQKSNPQFRPWVPYAQIREEGRIHHIPHPTGPKP